MRAPRAPGCVLALAMLAAAGASFVGAPRCVCAQSDGEARPAFTVLLARTLPRDLPAPVRTRLEAAAAAGARADPQVVARGVVHAMINAGVRFAVHGGVPSVARRLLPARPLRGPADYRPIGDQLEGLYDMPELLEVRQALEGPALLALGSLSGVGLVGGTASAVAAGQPAMPSGFPAFGLSAISDALGQVPGVSPLVVADLERALRGQPVALLRAVPVVPGVPAEATVRARQHELALRFARAFVPAAGAPGAAHVGALSAAVGRLGPEARYTGVRRNVVTALLNLGLRWCGANNLADGARSIRNTISQWRTQSSYASFAWMALNAPPRAPGQAAPQGEGALEFLKVLLQTIDGSQPASFTEGTHLGQVDSLFTAFAPQPAVLRALVQDLETALSGAEVAPEPR